MGKPSTLLSLAATAVGVSVAYTVIQSRRKKEIPADSSSIHNNNNNETRPGDAVDDDSSSPTPPPPSAEITLTPPSSSSSSRRLLTRGAVTIVHCSMTGTCKRFAEQLQESLTCSFPVDKDVQLVAVDELDWWDELVNQEEEEENDDDKDVQRTAAAAWLILLLPTYTNGTWPPVAEPLETALQELLNDWRISKHPLKNQVNLAVFGMGSSAYDNMGTPAKQAVRLFTKLGAKCRLRLVVGDDAVGNQAQEAFALWSQQLMTQFNLDAETGQTSKTKTLPQIHETEELDASPLDNAFDDGNDDYPSDSDSDDGEPDVLDVEDMGDAVAAADSKSSSSTTAQEPPDMITPSQAKSLMKEGYKLIGTHSAVKLCRWTKHQLRGRGGCYKHTFYGITSYQCMEATPSLACANKCVFCWRHHKNPVGKEWKWKVDDPQMIVQEAVDKHVLMIREAKGIPGVRMDRWNDALTPKHCALSLVGEPIMYPHINGLLGELHARDISTFLVTNGQHPQAIHDLRPITQLYVSVDAPTQESLIEIDRPLFQDAWDRLKQSLSCLKAKGQRTVARLTVVKGWNSDDIAGYAQLIALGHVSLVEVKGVTFCGKSDASNLNMTNTPWHHEVVDLTKTLRDELTKLREAGQDVPEYGLACEHKHSCSVLLARVDQFLEEDPATGAHKWKTWIDYVKFQRLAARHAEDPSFTFGVEDYTSETPAWALFGANEAGFDPTDTRHRKKSKHPMYTQFDEHGVPTHDSNDEELSIEERKRLADTMDTRIREIGSGSTVTELRGGAKEIQDVSLMYRGLVVAK